MRRKLLTILCFVTLIGANAQFNGKPLYDIMTVQNGDTLGTFRLELYPTIAPLHVKNFDSLAQLGFYDSTAFHRIIPGFVIQGGDPNSRNMPPKYLGFWRPKPTNS